MKIDLKRFFLAKIGRGRKFHIFFNSYRKNSICLCGSASPDSPNPDEADNVCRICAKEYEKTSKSVVAQMFMG